MIIAEHHMPGHWRYDPSFAPKCAWPLDCTVQWGGGGLVVRKDDSAYTTAFFEAFPLNGGFIRGEGKTVEEAEQNAFAKFSKHQACSGHVYGRRGYNNGAGVCLKCNHFKSHAFEEIYQMGAWRKPLTKSETWLLRDADEEFRNRDPKVTKYYRKLALRKMFFGVEEEPSGRGLEGLMNRILDDGK